MKPRLTSVILLYCLGTLLPAATITNRPTPGDAALTNYFASETARLADNCLNDLTTAAEWRERQAKMRGQLQEMLGLSPMPAKTDLKPVITGRVDHGDFVVENLHFQSLPQLYVTANLYLPKQPAKPLPAILYVCGHGQVKSNGVSYGNKTSYQHHGAWYARNGYVCLTIDTIQLGELEGLHHGTHREGMWWWNARGYTPAGVEAWNGIRGIDYLQSRSEVDGARIGVTGRSGGGAYSWWIAALDERVKAACPTAGITDLHNHVVDGVVQGHCDCMFMVNTYRWDYAQVAALVAPRPLLICNTDKDGIFPLDGVQRLHEKVRRVYKLSGGADKLGLLVTEGPHKDTQDLQVPVFRWFNRHLKGEEPLIEAAAVKFFPPSELKVFAQKPADERTTKIHETFVPLAPAPAVPADAAAWQTQRDEWLHALTEKCFRGWPDPPSPFEVNEVFAVQRDGLRFAAYDFASQEFTHLRLYVADAQRPQPSRVTLRVLDEKGWANWLDTMSVGFAKELNAELAVQKILSNTPPRLGHRESQFDQLKRALQANNGVLAFFAPRGLGLDSWNPTDKQRPHVSRRFMLLGQTVDGMRVWDIKRAVEVGQHLQLLKGVPFEIEARGNMGVNALYASLFQPGIAKLKLAALPVSHRDGPDYLNVLRFLDVPQAAAMVAERCVVDLSETDSKLWAFPQTVGVKLGWPRGRFEADAN